MAKIQQELMLTNITFQIVSDELNKVPVTDPLGVFGIVDGKYNIRLGALTNAQFAELHAFCALAGIHVADFTASGDSYRTMVVCGISITSIGSDGLFVIPDRTQNPHMTIKLSHIPGTDWIDLVSIKPYTTGVDEEDEMKSIIGELKEFADKIGTPVVTAEQPKISDRVTLHGVVIRKVARPNDIVVDYTFDNVSDEDLAALTKLYEEHPLINRPMDRHQLISILGGEKNVVTIGIFGYKLDTPRDTPIDITLELHRGQIDPTICDVTLADDKQSDSKLNLNIKKEENIMKNVSIKKAFFNGHATIIMWSDGTKTVVKPIAGEKFDPEMGIAMALARKFFGSGHQAEKFTANVFRESYARDVKSLTEKELLMLLKENEAVIAESKTKHDAVHQAYEKAVQEGLKKLPKLYGLKSDPDYRYASIRVSVIKAELESRKAKKKAASKKKTTKK